MPIYEYQCTECKHEFEIVWAKMGQEEKIRVGCPKCNETSKRVPSGFSFTVRGFNASNGYSGNMR